MPTTSAPVSPTLVLAALPQAPPGAQGPPGTSGSGYGYACHSDSQFTLSAPLTIMASNPTPLPIDSLGLFTDDSQLRAPFAGAQLWRNSRFYPQNLKDSYVIQVSFRAMSLVIDNVVKLTIDVDDGAGAFYDQRQAFDTVAGEARTFNFPINVFDVGAFFTNGGGVMVDCLTAPMMIWGASILIQPISVGQ